MPTTIGSRSLQALARAELAALIASELDAARTVLVLTRMTEVPQLLDELVDQLPAGLVDRVIRTNGAQRIVGADGGRIIFRAPGHARGLSTDTLVTTDTSLSALAEAMPLLPDAVWVLVP